MDNDHQRLEGYRRLIEIARDLASTFDLDVLLSRIINAAADLTEAGAASILLYDDAIKQLSFQVSTNMDEPTMRGLVVSMDSIAGWVVSNRKPLRVSNAHEDVRFSKLVEQTTQFTTESIMGVPLITKNKVVGCLEVLNKHNGDFTGTDEDLLTVLGAQAAVAIENTRLFQQSDLVAEFVHELRTPLSSIGTATYLLLRPEMSQEQREQMVHNIHTETQRLTTLASTFLDLARLESGRVQFHIHRFPLRPVLEECKSTMQSAADKEGITINIDIQDDFPEVEADRDKFKQVVLNLISNAIKYNRPQGSVNLIARVLEKEWMLTVRDTGIGIPEDALPRLFQKFYRVKGSESKAIGTGLGLSICKKIVTGHGGSIDVLSRLGEGTTFIIKLPRRSQTGTIELKM
jgi:signal transduction histidine kinase